MKKIISILLISFLFVMGSPQAKSECLPNDGTEQINAHDGPQVNVPAIQVFVQGPDFQQGILFQNLVVLGTTECITIQNPSPGSGNVLNMDIERKLRPPLSSNNRRLSRDRQFKTRQSTEEPSITYK